MRARCAAAALLAGGAAGHGTMVQPMPRASGGSKSAPSFPGAGSNFPGCAGDACLWYNVGCYIGCGACSSTGKDMYGTPQTNGEDGHGGPCTTPMEPTNNNASQRTNNPNGKSPHGDWTRYMPWRAPGFAPVVNPCGTASAFKPSSPNAPEIPAGHQQFENGTTLPPLSGSPVTWKAGEAAEVAWAISANHGGGYQYRVCPKSAEEPTEACFQAHVLPFTESTTTIRYTDGSRADVVIPSVTVTTGTHPAGSAWKKNQIPMCNCDVGQGCRAPSAVRTLDDTLAARAATPHLNGDGYTCSVDQSCANCDPSHTCPASNGTLVGCKKCADPSSGAPTWSCDECCAGCKTVSKSGGSYCDCGKTPSKPGQNSDMFTAYEVDPNAAKETPECPLGLQFPRLWDEGYGDGGNCLFPQGPNSPHCSPYMWTMNDKVRAPAAPGDYILSFRWDCEHTPQGGGRPWGACPPTASLRIPPASTRRRCGTSALTSPSLREDDRHTFPTLMYPVPANRLHTTGATTNATCDQKVGSLRNDSHSHHTSNPPAPRLAARAPYDTSHVPASLLCVRPICKTLSALDAWLRRRLATRA